MFLDALTSDLRFALRAVWRRPVLSLAAVLTLAAGIAANTAVFSVVNAALFKTVPGVATPERLVLIGRRVGNGGADVTFSMYRHLAAQNDVLEGLAALSVQAASIEGTRGPVARGSLAVAGDYFGLLGTPAARGRTFTPDERDGVVAPPVAVITHDLWQSDFAGAPDIVGRLTRINGVTVEIIGVLPPGFAGHHTGLLVDVFVPLGLAVPGIGGSSVELLGRLRPGIATAQAARILDARAHPHALAAGEATAALPYAVEVDAWGPLPALARGPVAAFLGALLVVVGLALAMACLNVSTILLARASERQREFAVRRALGAGEIRLARQVLTEVGMLFAAAGVAGVTAAAWLLGLIRGVTPPVALPGRLGADLSLDVSVLLFAVALTLGCALLFSVLPALQSGRFDLAPALREGGASDGPTRLRLRSSLVAVQLAVTSVLLAATLIAARSLQSMRALEPGWDGTDVLVAGLDLEQRGTPVAEGPALQQTMRARIAALRGVASAALATKLPRGGRSSFGPVWVPNVETHANLNRVSPGYFATLRIPLLRGRDFTDGDDARQPLVAIVNATMARRLWGDEPPLERTFAVGRGPYQRDLRVVGVARDAEARFPDRPVEPFYYVPLAQWYNAAAVLHVRTEPGRGALVAAAVPKVLGDIAPSLPTAALRPMNEALGVYLLPHRLAAWVAGVMTTFALLLAAVGVYGVSAFLVSRRGREIAVRQALGAPAASVARLLLVRNGRGALVGIAIGVALAIVATVGAARVVPGAVTADPVVLAGVPLVLACCAGAAVLVPVRRLLRRPIATLLRD